MSKATVASMRDLLNSVPKKYDDVDVKMHNADLVLGIHVGKSFVPLAGLVEIIKDTEASLVPGGSICQT